MAWLSSPEAWIALFTLVILEIVLGIDNIIFISILAGKLPREQQNRARVVGLAAAMVTRILLLVSLKWVIGLTQPLFAIDLSSLLHTEFRKEVSGRDLILLMGGLFLIGKSTFEIHDKMEVEQEEGSNRKAKSFVSIIIQIMFLDIVFSLDSVITAVGMADDIGVMVTAVVISVLVMMAFAKPVGNFVDRHPTVKMLALSFLLLIGFSLVAEGMHFHVPKGYIYFAMFFSMFVELLNLKLRGSKPVKLTDSKALAEIERRN